MVKITCPVCGGTGRVSSNFGTPCPYPYYQPTWIYQPTNQPTCQSQATTNSVNWYIPSTTTTYLNFPCEKTCPACGGTGLQECDHRCHCCGYHHHKCCCHDQKRRVIEKPPCPDSYIPFTQSAGTATSSPSSNTYTISFSQNDTPTSRKRSRIDEL
jgi:hypothetical protein